jgi:hypothetical protein
MAMMYILTVTSSREENADATAGGQVGARGLDPSLQGILYDRDGFGSRFVPRLY